MKLLVDMNLSPRWARLLAEAGFDATHWSSLGPATAAATGLDRPSVVQIRSRDVSPDAIGGPVIGALRQMADELDAGALLTVDPYRTRLRILPLQSRR